MVGLNLRRAIRIASLLTASLMMIVSFQNCSPGFSVMSSDSPSQASSVAGKVRVFVATGHMGRTILSCDGGRSWIHDQSVDDQARCWVGGDPHYVECDHTPYSNTGLDYADGAFYANFGWGYNGTVRKTIDGQQWATVKSGGWGGGVAAIGQTVIAFWGPWGLSKDGGASWNTILNSPENTLAHPLVRRVGNVLLALGRQSNTMVSHDVGENWISSVGLSDFTITSLAGNDARIVSVGTVQENNVAAPASAISDDRGLTWTVEKLTTLGDWSGHWGSLVFTGHHYISWSNGRAFVSSNGINWVVSPLSFPNGGGNSFGGPVAYDPVSETYALIESRWGNYYENQNAFRSTDGISWTLLDSQHFRGGHPINMITAGEADAAVCSR